MTVETQYVYSVISAGRWLFSSNIVGVEDSVCTLCSASGDAGIVTDFNFSISSDAIIDEVLIIIKCGVTGAGQRVIVSIYDGSNWITKAHFGHDVINCSGTYFVYADVTDILDTPAKINACQIKCVYTASGGGVPGEMLPYTGYIDAEKMKVTYHVPVARKVIVNGFVVLTI